MKNYSFLDKVILRTPLNKVETDITWDKILAAFQNPLYQEALFVASSGLYNLFKTYLDDPEAFQKEELSKLKTSLYKYYSRFSNRCTPFGLFAYVSSLSFARESSIDIANGEIRKSTKFDTFFLSQLLLYIDQIPAIRNVLVYQPNTTICSFNEKYRYVEYYHKENIRLHKLSAVDSNEYLDKILTAAKNGANLDSLKKLLVNDQISEAAAEQYLQTLIDNQFLVSELEINVTGEDYLTRLTNIFAGMRFNFEEGKKVYALLHELKQRIDYLEKKTATVNDYLSLFEFAKQQFEAASISTFFQVDAGRKLDNNTLSYQTIKKLRAAVRVLNKLSSSNVNNKLAQFKQKFTDRYEDFEIPLNQALDPDIGIGYATELGAKTPLIEGLSLGGGVRDSFEMKWDTKKSYIFKKLMAAISNGDTEIEILDKELNQFEEKEDLYFDTFSVFFNAFRENQQDKLMLRGVWGPTANNLIGRFCHLDDDIYQLAEEIANEEAKINEDKVIAEIVHLPQARIGNVIHRKNQRAYEIPYLSKSSLSQDRQIPIDDLMVSIKGGKIVLRSKKLQKEVLPRLSNAHNYIANTLPVYHFLCDLQSQNNGHVGFSWGELYYEHSFLPRIVYNDVLISRATWLFQQDEIKKLVKNRSNPKFLQEFIQKKKLPNVVSLVKGDNEVVINFSNKLSCEVFFSMIKNKKVVELKEFLFQEPCVTGDYANEFVASVYQSKVEKKINFHLMTNSTYTDKVKKAYSIGGDWLYYKFYCGDKIAERVLQTAITPAINDLKDKKIIRKFFFIRYADKNGFHLRLRLLLNSKQDFNHCINALKYHISPLEQEGVIWKTQIDTYLREVERYGYNAIEHTESLYHYDSEATLAFVNLIDGDEGEQMRWLFSLLSMDALLSDFGLSLKEKCNVMNLLKSSFGQEFNRKGLLNKQINDLYNTNEVLIENILSDLNTNPHLKTIKTLLAVRSQKNEPVVSALRQLEKNKDLPLAINYGIMPSYIHMICNRIFLNKQRIHEMVVYDFMYKYYSKKLHTAASDDLVKTKAPKS